MAKHITILRLSKELDLDRSSLRKAVIKLGIPMLRVRSRASRGQASLAVTLEHADVIRQHYAWRLE